MKTPSAPASAAAPGIRLAWLLSFALTVALIVLLGFVRAAEAAVPAGPSGPVFSVASWEDEEDEEEGEEEFELEEEFEEGEDEAWAACEELEEGEEQESCEEEIEAAEELEELEECTLSDAAATVTASPARNTVRLALRYKTFEPGPVTVHPRLRGGKGGFDFGRTTQRFSGAGVFRETSHLSDAQMAKVMAGHQFTVQLSAPQDPSLCDGLFDQQLSRHGGSAPVWR